jgi:hypothetical protein
MMVHNTRNYWVFGLCPSSGILKNGLNRVGVFLPHLRTETDPVSETLCSSEYWTMDKAQKPSNSDYFLPVLVSKSKPNEQQAETFLSTTFVIHNFRSRK